MPELFGIPQYSIKRQFIELHPKTYEPWVARWMHEKGVEAVALELRETRLVCHVESVIASLEV